MPATQWGQTVLDRVRGSDQTMADAHIGGVPFEQWMRENSPGGGSKSREINEAKAMPDIWETMIGAPPSGPEATAQAARSLRNQSDFGMLGMVSGDKVLSPMGQGMMTQAQERAGGLQQARQKGISEERITAFNKDTMENWKNKDAHASRKLDETIRHNEALEATALLAAQNKPGGQWLKMTGEARNTLADSSQTLKEMTNLSTAFEKDPKGISGSGFPMTGTVANFMASNAPMFTGEDTEEKQKWWAAWDRVYNLPERNKMFGATLTDNEKAVWSAANINPNMEAHQIRDAMKAISEIYERKLGERTDSMVVEGYNPEVMDVYRRGGGLSPYSEGQVQETVQVEGEPITVAPQPAAAAAGSVSWADL